MGRRKVAVVTGASSGIGLATAKALAAAGWQVIALGRDPARSAVALQEIQAVSSGGAVRMILADLSLMADALRAAQEVASHCEYLDVLINNAGGMTKSRVMTAEGYEQNFAGITLARFF
jgi:NAD(P)-dependent dehydrogenase (short-subunit alcohol dehydrogenase family)